MGSTIQDLVIFSHSVILLTYQLEYKEENTILFLSNKSLRQF